MWTLYLYVATFVAPAYGMYISVETIFHSLRCLSRFPEYMVAVDEEATDPKVLSGLAEVITSKILRSPSWRNIYQRLSRGVRVARSLILCVYFEDRCLSFCPNPIGHRVVSPSSIYGFWLPPCHLQTLLPYVTSSFLLSWHIIGLLARITRRVQTA